MTRCARSEDISVADQVISHGSIDLILILFSDVEFMRQIPGCWIFCDVW
ncbi:MULTISPECIES: hypothetical protein [unclassified Bradyrhizobium]|nr:MULTISPECIES: hypothetical protein [unclassified Bradyrhizobium]WGS20619.1 hypothetical protein MTX22_01995 [Bradyrhizobium sp. ISRA463]WGS27507.1 hypothetical protein MTX19_38865 [Bradyrhizobium sp. ISRA464]